MSDASASRGWPGYRQNALTPAISCSEDIVRAVRAMADEYDILVIMHMQEPGSRL
jgi:cytosine/adenosine deaminase-related metal-dependent hydrolase